MEQISDSQKKKDILNWAEQVLRTPFATSEREKLEMLEALGKIPEPRAVKFLTEALNLIEIPVRGSACSRAEVKNGGPISVAAARVLASSDSNEAGATLIKAVADAGHHPLLRSSILYGVHEARSPLLNECLQIAFSDPEWTVRRAALDIADTFFSNYDSDKEDVLYSLLHVYLYSTMKSEQEMFIQHSMKLLERMKEAAPLLDWVEEMLGHQKVPPAVGIRLISVVGMYRNSKAEEMISDLLLLKDQLPESYDYIARVLYSDRSPSTPVIEACQMIKNENGWLTTVSSVFSSTPAEVLAARRRAAETILSRYHCCGH